MRVFVSLLASLAIFAACIGVWWYHWPIWQVEARVKSRLSDPARASFSGVVYHKSTGAACGYVNGRDPSDKTHFILMPDGEVRFDPKEPVHGSTLQQLESLRKHADYLALAYAHCQPG